MTTDHIWLDDTTLRVMTYRSGSFVFQLGLDIHALQPLIDRINDAQSRFNKTPALPAIIDQMQERVTASSIYSTNTIEGGTYTEQQTASILQRDPATIQSSEERRLTNLKAAIDWIRLQTVTTLRTDSNATVNQIISVATCRQLHRMVSQDIEEKTNPSGHFRDNQKGQKTIVSNADHGGAYRPPKCLADIEMLIEAWATWLNHPAIMAQSPLIRAVLAHYYFELIHPFWDGNGRTGRLLEMLLLEQTGYRFSSAAIWVYYQQNLHAYFALFNHCRKLADKKQPEANQAFVAFFLKGMFATINQLHDHSSVIISVLMLKSALSAARMSKLISERQFLLVETLMQLQLANVTIADLYRDPRIKPLYHRVTERTFYRDIEKLIESDFLSKTDNTLKIHLLT
jgi:Fic family protein